MTQFRVDIISQLQIPGSPDPFDIPVTLALSCECTDAGRPADHMPPGDPGYAPEFEIREVSLIEPAHADSIFEKEHQLPPELVNAIVHSIYPPEVPKIQETWEEEGRP